MMKFIFLFYLFNLINCEQRLNIRKKVNDPKTIEYKHVHHQNRMMHQKKEVEAAISMNAMNKWQLQNRFQSMRNNNVNYNANLVQFRQKWNQRNAGGNQQKWNHQKNMRKNGNDHPKTIEFKGKYGKKKPDEDSEASSSSGSGSSPPGLLPLVNKGLDWEPPLLKCEGNCNCDGDCDEGLFCFYRNGMDVVHGCAIGGDGDVSGVNYCVDLTSENPDAESEKVCEDIDREKAYETKKEYEDILADPSKPTCAHEQASTCMNQVDELEKMLDDNDYCKEEIEKEMKTINDLKSTGRRAKQIAERKLSGRSCRSCYFR